MIPTGDQFFRADGDFYGILDLNVNDSNGHKLYAIGEFYNPSWGIGKGRTEPYNVLEIQLDIDSAKKLCEFLVETFSDGRNSCECG